MKARKRKDRRKGAGRDRLLGERFAAAKSKRLRRRALEKAGRRAARKR